MRLVVVALRAIRKSTFAALLVKRDQSALMEPIFSGGGKENPVITGATSSARKIVWEEEEDWSAER